MTFNFLVEMDFLYIFENSYGLSSVELLCYYDVTFNDKQQNMKKAYLFILLLMAAGAANAQTNLALAATCTHSGGGAGIYGPAEYNNGSISTAPATPWGWTNMSATGGWIEFDFGTSTSFNIIKLYHVNLSVRTMEKATIQTWTGSSWVTHEQYDMSSNPVLVYEYEFVKTATASKMRIASPAVFQTGGQQTNPNFREIEIFYKPRAPINAGVTSISKLSVCDATQDISVRAGNFGTKYLDSFDLDWSLNGVSQPQMTYNSPHSIGDTLTANQDTLLTLKTAYTFTPFTEYAIKVWTSNPNGMTDTVPDDDTAEYTFTFYGSPSAPTGGSFSFCGIGQKPITASPAASGDSLFWFTEKTGGSNFAIGKNVMTPFLYASDTFYISSYRVPSPDTANNRLAGTTIVSNGSSDWEGGAIDVTAGSSDVILTQLSFEVQRATNTDYVLYTKSGTYDGYQSDRAFWTKFDSGQAMPNTRASLDNMMDFPVTMVIPAGQTQSFYFMITNNDVQLTRGNVGVVNEFVKTSSTDALLDLFSNQIYKTWTVNHELTYHAPSCSNNSAREAVTVEILRLPTGASLEKGTPFNGTYTSGTMTDPDIVAANDQIVYDLTNPTLFPNNMFGSTWTISDTTLATTSGIEVNMGTMVTIGATSSTDASFSFTPDSSIIAFTDSLLVLRLSLQNIATGCDTVVERYIFVAPRADPGFSLPAALCQNDPISFINTSTISTGGILYRWDFGDGDTSVAPNTSHAYALPGTYKVVLRTTSTPYGYVTSTSKWITVEETPQANFTRENACMGDDVILTNTSTYGGAGSVVYNWDFGDGSTISTNTNETHSYAAPNSYEVTLTADVAGCFSEITKTVYQFAKPVVDFTAPSSSVCNYTEVTFPNNSIIANGTMGSYWDYGNMENSNQKDGKTTFESPQSFPVKLKMISEFGCTDSLEKSVTVLEGSDADFTYDLGCIENPTNFTFTGQAPAGQAPTIIWTFDIEGQDGGSTVSHQWQSTGSKFVQAKVVLNNGCNDSITKTISVLDQPDVDFDFNGMCEEDEVIFQNNSKVGTGTMDFDWDFKDGGTSTKTSPTHKFVAGTYDVQLKASIAQGCADSTMKQIVVSANPDCDFSISDEYVNGHRGFKFTPIEGGLPHYRWRFGEGGTSSSDEPVYQYLNDGSYSVTLFARNAAGCECEKTISNEVKDVVSIGDNELTGVNVYPNPTTGMLRVDLPGQGDYTIEVLNVIGKVIFTKEVSNATDNLELNLSENANGIYLIKITSNNKSKTVKVNLLK